MVIDDLGMPPYDEGRERLANYNRKKRRRRLALSRARCSHDPVEWGLLLNLFGWRCAKCAVACWPQKDHIIPVYQGGCDGLHNLQPLCQHCNGSKGSSSINFIAKWSSYAAIKPYLGPVCRVVL